MSSSNNDMPPAVSIIMPVYNGAKFLPRMIDCIIAQSLTSWELICIDDGSTDDSIAILESYAAKDDRIQFVKQKNMGGCLARNTGIARAKGEFVYICDQDDYVHPQAMEFLVWLFLRHDLDFISFYNKKFYTDEPPKVAPLGDFASIPVTIVEKGRECEDVKTSSHALASVQIDVWAQFTTRELAQKCPSIDTIDIARTFRLIQASHRWAFSPFEDLYHYYKSTGVTWSTRPLGADTIKAVHRNLVSLFEQYSKCRSEGDRWNAWKTVRRGFMLKNLKMELNGLKRRNKNQPKAYQDEAWRALAEEVRDLNSRGALSWREIKLRHAIKYLLLMLKYR